MENNNIEKDNGFRSSDDGSKTNKKEKHFGKKQIILLVLGCFLVSSVVGFFSGVLALRFAADTNSGAVSDTLLNFLKNKKEISKENVSEDRAAYAPVTTQEETVIDVAKNASHSVVSIIITKDLPVMEQYNINPFGNGADNTDPFQQFFQPFQIPQYRQNGTQKQEVGGGTGFVISSKDGLILTNKHVVDIDGAEYTVLDNDGNKYPAKVVAKDPVQDIAVVQIDKKDLPELKLGDSDSIQQGQTVIAIGNALGEFRNTINVGVISGLRRTVTAGDNMGQSETLEEVIQTDAAINPGNSGGPLLNLKGEVIGINTAIAQGAQNIGFAIPINKAKKDLEQVKTGGKISTPFLGIRYIIINKDIQKKNNLTVDYGALVLRGEQRDDLAVAPGSPADKAGIVENDIILEIDGKKIAEDNSLSNIVQSHSVGDELTLKVMHKGETKDIKVKLEERK
jgi:S1-C subfamily serine protease